MNINFFISININLPPEYTLICKLLQFLSSLRYIILMHLESFPYSSSKLTLGIYVYIVEKIQKKD